MDIQLFKSPFDYAIIDNFYTEEEFKKIKKEIEMLFPLVTTTSLYKSKPALDEKGFPIRSGNAVFVDVIFSKNRDESAILSLNRKIFSKEVTELLIENSVFFKHLSYCDTDYTLLNIYQQGENYSSHVDKAIWSAVTFVSLGEFKGGEFVFTDYDLVIESKENRIVIFPSCVDHHTLPIEAAEGNCRASIAQFLNYKNS